MIVVTGGAGFIGSNLVAALGARGARDVGVCDWLGGGAKWRNIAKHAPADIVAPGDLADFLAARGAGGVEAVFHMGANASTTETDVDLIVAQNFTFSMALWAQCAALGIRLIYASSAATYGDGGAGFDDDGAPQALSRLRPLNPYGWSKHLFDQQVARGGAAAMGRAQVLQRLRAQRIPQGRHAKRGRAEVSPGPRRPPRDLVQVGPSRLR